MANAPILAVEDNSSVRRTPVHILERLGYSTFEAAGGSAAFTLLREHSEIGVIFSGIVMPGGRDGCELAKPFRVLCLAGQNSGGQRPFTTGHASERAEIRGKTREDCCGTPPFQPKRSHLFWPLWAGAEWIALRGLDPIGLEDFLNKSEKNAEAVRLLDKREAAHIYSMRPQSCWREARCQEYCQVRSDFLCVSGKVQAVHAAVQEYVREEQSYIEIVDQKATCMVAIPALENVVSPLGNQTENGLKDKFVVFDHKDRWLSQRF